MPSLIDIRRRIRSVKSTEQITKAMKMAAAAKRNRLARTIHVIPRDGGWVVTKEGSGERCTGVHSTQNEAIETAREMLQRKAGQIVINRRDGSIRLMDVNALPVVQASPLKSSIGTKAIKEAVSAVIRERLVGD